MALVSRTQAPVHIPFQHMGRFVQQPQDGLASGGSRPRPLAVINHAQDRQEAVGNASHRPPTLGARFL
jgi:hypothetical protein